MIDKELIEKAFNAHEGAPTWEDDPVGRDAAIRWHMRGFHDALAVFREHTEEPFCDQCAGPYPDDGWPGSQYAGHWDTCPNRPKHTAPTDDERAELEVQELATVIGNVVIDYEDTGPHSQRAITIRDTCADWPMEIAGEVQAHGFRRGVPADREQIAGEIAAEREDTEDGICVEAYINGLMRAEQIVREGR